MSRYVVSQVPSPGTSIVHWKFGELSALVSVYDYMYYYLLMWKLLQLGSRTHLSYSCALLKKISSTFLSCREFVVICCHWCCRWLIRHSHSVLRPVLMIELRKKYRESFRAHDTTMTRLFDHFLNLFFYEHFLNLLFPLLLCFSFLRGYFFLSHWYLVGWEWIKILSITSLDLFFPLP